MNQPSAPAVEVRWGTPAGRWVLAATVLGSGLVFLDGTSSNVALPAIDADLGSGVAGLQWTINAYTLALAALILLGGSLSDRFGRRRVFIIGTVWFATASLLCGLAPTTEVLIVARALQGVGGALLTPGSLAILQSSFVAEHRARAVGAWSGLSGIAAAGGPLVGGWLVDAWTWRLIFLTNLPVAVVVVLVAMRHVPESSTSPDEGGLDVTGAVLGAVGLGLTTWALIELGDAGPSATALATGAAGLAALAAFLVVERRRPRPLLPLGMFTSRQFVGANLVTLAVYAVLGGVFFLVFLQLQQVLGYSAVQAGAAVLPITGLLLVLSARVGALSERVGPRLPMTLGPLLLAGGLLLLARVDADAVYLIDVLPPVTVLGIGLSLTVAPLTATALAAVAPGHVGIASGVNNTIARVGGLLAVAALPPLAGIRGGALDSPAAFSAGFATAMLISAAVAGVGAALAWLLIRDDVTTPPDDVSPRAATSTAADAAREVARRSHCAVNAPPLAASWHEPQAEGGGGRAGLPSDRSD